MTVASLLLASAAVSASLLPSVRPLAIVPEVPPAHLARVSRLVSSALGDEGGAPTATADRYASARCAVGEFQSTSSSDADAGDGRAANGDAIPPNELVYGELSVEVLATILDAVGVREEGDVFLDIGSGDGALVLGASLLYDPAGVGGHGDGDDAAEMKSRTNPIRKAWGVDIVPGLVDRSRVHADNLRAILRKEDAQTFDRRAGESEADDVVETLGRRRAEVRFLLGDVHEPDAELGRALSETTLAVCFATTWSAGNARGGDATARTSLQGRRLPKLSRALSAGLTPGCRVVIIDGRLDEGDGFAWQGDLRVDCPDTAPYSVATLYHKQ